jgi:hypothetical protein
MATYHEDHSKARGAFQVAFAAATDEAGRKAAQIALYRALHAASLTYKISNGSLAALQRLGVDDPSHVEDK